MPNTLAKTQLTSEGNDFSIRRTEKQAQTTRKLARPTDRDRDNALPADCYCVDARTTAGIALCPSVITSNRNKAWALVRNAGFRRQLFGYIRGLFRSIKIKSLDVRLRLGLDDPADTGRLWGVLGPLASLLGGIRKANIRVDPAFAADVFSLQSQGRISVIPLRILWISLCFFLTPQVIRALAFKS